MALTARHRERTKKISSGSTTVISTGAISYWQYDESSEVTDDYTGKKKRDESYGGLLPPSNWDHEYVVRVPPTFTGTKGSWRHFGVPMVATTYPGSTGYPLRGTSQRNLENAQFALQVVAETHPFRYEFSIPVSIAELLDVGEMFKLTAKGFFDLIGTAYLQYKFGWVQFYNDIKTLHGITLALERRIKEFDSLSKNGGLRRTVKFVYSDSGGSSGGGYINSTYGVLIDSDTRTNWSYIVRATVRWRWINGYKISLSKLEAFNLAVSKLFDLGELDASTVWNAIPWTWLCDYFFDIGTFLSAHESQNVVEPFDICIVRFYRNKKYYYPKDVPAGIRAFPGYFIKEVKSRDVVGIPNVPQFRFSLMSKSQTLVLAALYAKFRGSHY